jgi:hypothetical protein
MSRDFRVDGPDSEEETTRYCPNCEEPTPFVIFTFEKERWGECQNAGCDYAFDIEPDEPDPDLLHDSRIDRE